MKNAYILRKVRIETLEYRNSSNEIEYLAKWLYEI